MDWYTGRIREPLIEGESVAVAGQSFVVAPFNIRRMRMTANARAVLRRIGEGAISADSDEAIAAITEIAAVALSANYPELTAAMLDEHDELRPQDLAAVLDALRRANGEVGINSDIQSGEAQAPLGGA